jgi:hypothetical protein
MKTPIILFFLLVTSLAFPQEKEPHENIKIFARIKQSGKNLEIIKNTDTQAVVGTLKDNTIKQDLEGFKSGDEALIEGYISYVVDSRDNKKDLRPVFIIESIKPISLSKLGKFEAKVHEKEIHIQEPIEPSRKGVIPVTGEVASAITLTASLLLLENLAAQNQNPAYQQDMTPGLIFSAGALATGLFIYEQIKGKKTKGK